MKASVDPNLATALSRPDDFSGFARGSVAYFYNIPIDPLYAPAHCKLHDGTCSESLSPLFEWEP
jgi:hypothetical protein